MRQVFWLVPVDRLPEISVALMINIPFGAELTATGIAPDSFSITPDFPFDSFRKPYRHKTTGWITVVKKSYTRVVKNFIVSSENKNQVCLL